MDNQSSTQPSQEEEIEIMELDEVMMSILSQLETLPTHSDTETLTSLLQEMESLQQSIHKRMDELLAVK